MVHFVTVATGDREQAAGLMESFARFGVSCVNLGAEKAYPAHGTKVVLLREFLADKPELEIICYVDAFDVLLIRDPIGIETAFEALKAEIVFYAEGYFTYKRNRFCRFRAKRRLPSRFWTNTEYRYLNAGCIVGYAGPLRNFLAALPVGAHTPCDQTPMVDYWIKNPSKLALDFQQTLFTGTGGREGFEKEDFDFDSRSIRNRLTDTQPFFVHFPGKNWVGMNSFLDSWGALRFRRRLEQIDMIRYQNNLKNNTRRLRSLGQAWI
mgnify:CR=1 FL=1